jgi:hypothetical protein
MRNTIVVNFIAGPGAAKSILTSELYAFLKRNGVKTEMALEYAKELTWEEKFEQLSDQEHVFDEQQRRLNITYGRVDVLITDSPLLVSLYYDPSQKSEFHERVLSSYHHYNNRLYFVERSTEKYEKAGRTQDLLQAQEIDNSLKRILNEYQIPYFIITTKPEEIVIIGQKILEELGLDRVY